MDLQSAWVMMGSIARSGACGVETRIDNELAEDGRFLEGDRGECGKEVLD